MIKKLIGFFKKNKYLYKLIPLFFMLLSFSVKSQDVDARSPKTSGGSRQQQVAEKKKAKQQIKIQKGVEKGKERHLKLQAKNTKKMIKKSKRSSKRWNENKKEFFLKRWFTKKHH